MNRINERNKIKRQITSCVKKFKKYVNEMSGNAMPSNESIVYAFMSLAKISWLQRSYYAMEPEINEQELMEKSKKRYQKKTKNIN